MGPAPVLPVARVLVDVSLAHLDRPFDYLVPDRWADTAVPGARVKVRFAGALVNGYVLERVAASEHPGRLSPLTRVVSAEPVLTPGIARLARAVADHYAGTVADVLRLAIPPRHARVEAEPRVAVPGDVPAAVPGRAWRDYPDGPGFVADLARGGSPRAVWTALPGPDWPAALAEALVAAASSGRGAVAVLPDAGSVDELAGAVGGLAGPGGFARLAADLGPARRYREWLRVLRGGTRIVVGTRAACFAPVGRLGLACLWDDGSDLHAEPHSPYPHAREVLLMRAHLDGAGVLLGGRVRTAEGARLIANGWARALGAPRDTRRSYAPKVVPAGDEAEAARDPGARTARLPSLALRTAREGLGRGPVLVQVPRAGYVPGVVCRQCRRPARCADCGGPLAYPARDAALCCARCGRPAHPGSRAAAAWECEHCGGRVPVAQRVGAGRTADELGSAFPGVPVVLSGQSGGATQSLDKVSADPVLVVATPGAEPVAAGGYAAALLLDGWALLGRPSLRAHEESLRRWANAASLVRPSAAGGTVVLVADGAQPPAQALVRWDPDWFAERELELRRSLGFPPAGRVAELTGAAGDIEDLLALTRLPAAAQILGPWPDPLDATRMRALVRAPESAGAALAAALRAAQGVRSAGKRGEHVRVRVDPVDLG